jgi:hypothetical protein
VNSADADTGVRQSWTVSKPGRPDLTCSISPSGDGWTYKVVQHPAYFRVGYRHTQRRARERVLELIKDWDYQENRIS